MVHSFHFILSEVRGPENYQGCFIYSAFPLG